MGSTNRRFRSGRLKRGGLGGVDKQEVWVASTKKGRFGSGRQKGEVWLGSRDELNILDQSLLNPFVEIQNSYDIQV